MNHESKDSPLRWLWRLVRLRSSQSYKLNHGLNLSGYLSAITAVIFLFVGQSLAHGFETSALRTGEIQIVSSKVTPQVFKILGVERGNIPDVPVQAKPATEKSTKIGAVGAPLAVSAEKVTGNESAEAAGQKGSDEDKHLILWFVAGCLFGFLVLKLNSFAERQR